MANHKPVHLIINPKSGYGGRKRFLADLRGAIRRRGFVLEEYVTQYAGDATRHAQAVADDAHCIISYGGDGTVNEIANGLLGSETPMLVAPAGTENLLAKELRISAHPEDLAHLVQHGKVVSFDLGQINERSFHSILGVGFDAEVVRRVSAQRTGHISHLSYFWPIWRTFWEHDFPHLRITSEDEELFDGRGMAFVGNISRYSTGLRICKDARFDDGLLDLVVFQCDQQARLVLHAAWTLLRRHPLKGNVIYRPVRTLRIETDAPLTCEVDGDVGPKAPWNITVLPQSIHLVVPPHKSHWGLTEVWPWKGDAPL